MLLVLLCKTCTVVKPRTWLASAPSGTQQFQDLSLNLSMGPQIFVTKQMVGSPPIVPNLAEFAFATSTDYTVAAGPGTTM